MARKYLLATLGCKVNQYESQQLREVVESFGLRPVRRGETPDLAVVNTCAVTSSAIAKNRQAIRRAAGTGQTPVIVVGCGGSADGEQLRRMNGVAEVFGHDVDACAELRQWLTKHLAFDEDRTPSESGSPFATRRTHPDVKRNEGWIKPTTASAERPGLSTRAVAHTRTGTTTRSERRIIPTALPIVKTLGTQIGRIETMAGHQRAFLKVQDGCDAHCTYCIIPQLRSVLRYKPVAEAVDEARVLVAAGHREIVVTGIFLGAYGRETAIRRRFSRTDSPLAELVRALARVEGLLRLRLSSLEPGDVDEALIEVLASEPVCVPHLHLPLQSGSAEVLRRMNRQYTRDACISMIERVKAALDRPAISTDIILGFPGETEADFEASVEIARHAGFCKIHAFPFSARQRTAAARWQREFVPRPVVNERMRRLAEVEMACSLAYRRGLLGLEERVIVEREHEGREGVDERERAIRHGRADRYVDIHFEAGAGVRTGDVVRVRVDRITPTRTHGTMIPSDRGVYPLPVWVVGNASS